MMSPGPLLTSLTVAICTFRRPSIVVALRSLARQSLVGVAVTVLVVDNDDSPSAGGMVAEAARLFGLTCHYLHVPGRNISIARNACLEACHDDWLAFLDDDEIASSNWLKALLARVSPMVAAVFGPVRATYLPGQPDWMVQGDFHSFNVVRVHGRILTGYTSNVLINMSHPAIRGRRFDLALGRSGGEDTQFFKAVYDVGGQLETSPDAVVEEIVVPERASFVWLLRRRFRSGQTHGAIIARQGSARLRVRGILSATAKALVCLAGAIVTFPSPAGWRGWILRGGLHAGVIARLLGCGEIELYGVGT
jgi:succinoglycan biosynthesis protein ExoM